MVRPQTFRAIMLGCATAAIALLSFAAGLYLGTRGQYSSALVETPPVEGVSTIRHVIRPGDVLLRFVPKDQFNATRVRHLAPFMVGYTLPNRTPCEVVLPAGDVVFLQPWTGKLRAWDPDLTDTILHELMHCQLGGWHADWSTIRSRR